MSPLRPVSTDPHAQHLDGCTWQTEKRLWSRVLAARHPARPAWLKARMVQELIWVCALSALTSGGFILDGLLEECDVPEGAEEEDHLIVFIPYGGDLHVKPYGCSCRTQLRWQSSFNQKIYLLINTKTLQVTPTVLGVEQHLVELWLVVVKGLSDFVDHLFISQVTVHEAVKRSRTQSWQQFRLTVFLSNNAFKERIENWMNKWFYHTNPTCMCCSCAWLQLCGTQTACRNRHCRKQPASQQSAHFPTRNWSLE